MEQSRLRLLAEFENMRFAERASCEVMPTGYPGCQPRTSQTAAPSRPHRLASLWSGLASRTQSPFAHAAQQARPFDSDTPIYSSKASLVAVPKSPMPSVQVGQSQSLLVFLSICLLHVKMPFVLSDTHTSWPAALHSICVGSCYSCASSLEVKHLKATK